MSNKTCVEAPTISTVFVHLKTTHLEKVYSSQHGDSTDAHRMKWNDGGEEKGSPLPVRALESILAINLRSGTNTDLPPLPPSPPPGPHRHKYTFNFLLYVSPLKTTLVPEKSSLP